MSIPHVFIALLIVFVWGINFLFVSLGLQEIPPLQLCTMRFFVSSVPAILFIPFPRIEWQSIALYGLVMFALQFSLLFVGMSAGMPAGIAALLIQVQVFFSLFFAVLFLDEQSNCSQLIGAVVSFSGIVVVAMHFDHHVSLIGFIFIIAAAATWGLGNLITKRIKTTNMISLIVWGSFVACIPMFILSLIFEGTEHFFIVFNQLSWKGISCIFYIAFGSTWIGYGLWNWLISIYPVGLIAPFTLLVPVIAMICSGILLGETFEPWKLMAALLVISGLSINLLGPRFIKSRVAATNL